MPLGSYVSLVRTPDVPRVLGGTVLGGVSSAMLPLGFVLLTYERTHSFAAAGAVTACYSLSTALASPFRGRTIDTNGCWVMVQMAVVRALALAGVVAAVTLGAGIPALVLGAIITGVARPPFQQVLRSLWMILVHERQLRQSAYALQASLTEIFFIGGPLAVAGFVAFSSPSTALLAAGIGSCTGAFLVATAPTARQLGSRDRGQRTPTLDVLRAKGMPTLALATLLIGMLFGAFDVAVPAFAAQESSRAASGILLALLAAGSAVGGLAYGARSWTASAADRFRVCLFLLTVALAAVPLARSLLELGLLLLVSGFFVAPVVATMYALLEDVSPPDTPTEALGWITMAFALGMAAGTAATGVIIGPLGIGASLAFPVACSLAAVVVVTVWGFSPAPPTGAPLVEVGGAGDDVGRA